MELPQRVLAVKLRTAIDRAMARPGARWVEAVQRLRRENPHGSTSSHVGHNLGAARRAWLARLDTMENARSLEEDMVRKSETLPEGPTTMQCICKHELMFHDASGCREHGCKCRSFQLPQAIRGDAVPEKKG
jgi:hypothetical protein